MPLTFSAEEQLVRRLQQDIRHKILCLDCTGLEAAQQLSSDVLLIRDY